MSNEKYCPVPYCRYNTGYQYKGDHGTLTGRPPAPNSCSYFRMFMSRTSSPERFRKVSSVISLLFFSVTLSLGKPHVTTPRGEVVVFVLDSFFEGEESHGDLVARLIEKNCTSPLRLKRKDIVLVRGGLESGYLVRLNEVLNYATAQPKEHVVVNISLGSNNYDYTEHTIIKRLFNLGAVIVASAGNSNSPSKVYPAAYEEVIAVGAMDSSGGKEDYSNYGSYIDLVAKGRGRMKIENKSEVQSPIVETTIIIRTGTSFAAARVTALVADILARRPDFSNQEVLKVLKDTSDPFSLGQYPLSNTAGRINPVRSLLAIDPVFRKQYAQKQSFERVVAVVSIVGCGILAVSAPFMFLRAVKQDKIASAIRKLLYARYHLAETEEEIGQLGAIGFQTKFVLGQEGLADYDTLQTRLTRLAQYQKKYEMEIKTSIENLYRLGLDDSKINKLLAKYSAI